MRRALAPQSTIGSRLLLLAVAAVIAAGSARAGGFDATTGKVTTAGAAFALAFDVAADLTSRNATGSDAFNQTTLDAAALAERLVVDETQAIEGTGALALGGDINYVSLDMAGLTDFIGRRVEVTLWQKPEGTRMLPSLTWYAGDPTSPTYLGVVAFQPTGDVTDDGWEQWTSGPVDFAWAEVVPPASLDLVDENLAGAYGGLSENKPARSLVDALAITDLGAAAVPATACALPTEHADCGETGLCQLGRCVDAAIRAGQPILDAAMRADYIDRRAFEVATFEGGRSPETRAGLVKDALEPLKDAPLASTFWPTFAEAYTLLVDGHASAPMVAYPAYQNAGVCVHQGVADLLPGAPEVPLVFQPGTSVVGAGLQPGDALVRIDGVPVEAWAASAGRLVQHPGDPVGKVVVTAPQLFVAAADAGAVATFARCAQSTPCSEAEVQEITIDLKALLGDPLLAGQSGVGYSDIAACDYRFVRPVPSTTSTLNTDYAFAGHADDGDVRFLVINGVPGQYDQGGQAWFNGVAAALQDGPPKVVLDERTGDGGGIDAVDWIGGALVTAGDWFAMDFLPGIEGDDLASDRQAVVDCSSSAQNTGYGCGNGFRWSFGSVAGSSVGEAGAAKLAVLIGLDVSGNDYLTKLLRHRTGETRIFGAGSTWGAFGVIWTMAAHMGELAGGSLQVQDTIFLQSDSDDNTTFPTSTGERPDEIVLQKQSDAMLGKDTTIEAAKAWLAQ